MELPTISIVIPNYNGGATLKATLQSLVEQNYPALEIVVVDGGSTDNSVEIIKQFESHIAWWVSEKDKGQSDAINKGFSKCTGEIINWLCSDDCLEPGALHVVGKHFAQSVDIDVLVGRSRMILTEENLPQPLKSADFWITFFNRLLGTGTRYVAKDEQNEKVYIRTPTAKQIALMPIHCPIAQPSCFYRRKLLDRSQPIDESYEYAMDFELWNYFISKGARWHVIDDILSTALVSTKNKTSTAGVKATYELERLYKTYVKEWIPLTFWHRYLRYPLERTIKRNQGGILLYLLGPVWVTISLMLAPFYGLERVWALRWTRF